MDKKEDIIAPCKGETFRSPRSFWIFELKLTAGVQTFPSSELRRLDGQEPAAAGHLPGGAAEMGEPAGEEDPQEASTR